MEALEFLRNYDRMCSTIDKCSECPAVNMKCCELYTDEQAKLVEIVEQWAKEHPEEAKKKRTNKDVLLAVLPNVDTSACPKMLDMNYKCDKRKLCAVCKHEFWNEEV